MRTFQIRFNTSQASKGYGGTVYTCTYNICLQTFVIVLWVTSNTIQGAINALELYTCIYRRL